MNNETRTEFRQLEIAEALAAFEAAQLDRNYRDSHRLFYVEGVRGFIAAIDNRFPVNTVLYSERLLIHPLARKFVRRLKRAGVPFARVTPEQFRRISRAERASGVAAIVQQRLKSLDHINSDSHTSWTALSHIRSPGNLGSLMRTSAATGAKGFILLGDSIDPFNPVVVRASMGSLFKQTIVRTSCAQLKRWLQDNSILVIGASPDAMEGYHTVDRTSPLLLMLGGERRGLTEEQRSLCNRIVRIPMAKGMDSLNVAVAGSLLMYQLFGASER